ncbi:MAG: DNA gyrase inhibitor YacG [Robiginitomaculum sp.]|nr:DNA gyrase inhibitor YacG [Robiginitomaculum sp.]
MKSILKCPLCKKPSDQAHKPFCSDRCRQVDLGRWLKGSYVVPGADEDQPEHLPGDVDK